MRKIRNVLSLFNGISCGNVSLEKSGIRFDTYYSSEIDSYAIQITQSNYPNTVQLGDVTNWREWDIDWSSIDLLLAGSPCTQISKANTSIEGNKGIYGKDSVLFFTFSDILNHIKIYNPDVKFLLENVKMKQEYKDTISEYVGTKPVLINSALVSAQSRHRLYWTNLSNAIAQRQRYLTKGRGFFRRVSSSFT